MDDKWERAMLASKVDKIDKRVDRMEIKIMEMVIRLESEPLKKMQIAIGSADGFLPDHLEKTKRAIKILGNATAGDVAKVTNRARAVESSYLCQLERMGILTGERVGKTKWFRTVTEPFLIASEIPDHVLQHVNIKPEFL
jgi:ArsR family transcriptional regulator, lead/cadmium/zinc/bismuth-responsive transcriptional repressor